MDYGFRISRTGIDVKTGDDKDMVITSKYPNLKGNLSGSGPVSVTEDGVNVTVNVAHGLGYIPMAQGFWSENNSNFGLLPYFNYLHPNQLSHNIKADSTNVILKFNDLDLIN